MVEIIDGDETKATDIEGVWWRGNDDIVESITMVYGSDGNDCWLLKSTIQTILEGEVVMSLYSVFEGSDWCGIPLEGSMILMCVVWNEEQC